MKIIFFKGWYFMISKDIEIKMKEIINGCLECKTKPCMQNCIMLHDFGEDPKDIFQKCLGMGEIPDLLAYSCNMCNQCTAACPQNYKINEIFLESRKGKVLQNKGKSPIKGHTAISAHQYLGFSKLFTTTNKAPKSKQTKKLFIPGCSLPSYNPEAVGNILDYLQEKYPGEVGSILKCCGKPTREIGQMEKFEERYADVQKTIDETGAEEIIVACQSCYEVYSKYAKKQRVRSLWEVLPEIGLPENAKQIGINSDIVLGLHDSCATRYNVEIQDGVRWILNEMGYKVEEPANTREKTRCCGFGGMVAAANPNAVSQIAMRRGYEFSTEHIVSYCAACRESIETAGKDSVHILDLIFGEKYEHKSATKRNQSSIKQWKNRFKSKLELNKRK
jgi:Fe-S oxidoreductase